MKTDSYHSLTRIIQETPKHETNLALGDFSARIMEVLPQEQHLLGSFIYRETDLSQGEVDKRQRFIEFCADHQLTPMNTWFEKPIPKLATYRTPTANTFGVNIDTSKYSQLGLHPDKWSLEKRYHRYTNNPSHTCRFRPCASNCNIACQTCKEKVFPYQQETKVPDTNRKWTSSIQSFDTKSGASKETRRPMVRAWPMHIPSRDFESSCETNLNEDPHQSKEGLYFGSHMETYWRQSTGHRKQLSKIIKQEARKDKEDMLLKQLEKQDAQGCKWDGLKAARKTFQPKRTKFKNRNSELIKEADFAIEAAKYLAEVQWAQPKHNDINQVYENNPLDPGNFCMRNTNFTLEELNKVINAQKNNKSPGPYNWLAELTKWLDDTNRSTLLEILNSFLDDDGYPDSLEEANIVSIYKKRDATQMKNYRRIALLQTKYLQVWRKIGY